MSQNEPIIDVCWTGPFAWPDYEDVASLQPIPRHPGVYLQTFEYEDGFLIYAAGITRRDIPTRFREHTNKYLSGDYTVLDLAAIKEGKRREIWHGWGWTPEKEQDFESRKSEILEGARNQLAGFRIFVTDIGTAPRILERLEAAVMNSLYEQPSPYCDIPDPGMQLAPRWDSESILIARATCSETLHRLPQDLPM